MLVYPEGLGRGVPMYMSPIIAGEPIAINRAQILTPSCY